VPKEVSKPAADPLQHGVATLSRRLRVLEERYTILRRKGQLSDESLIRAEDELRKELQRLSSEVQELHRTLVDLDDKMDRFLEEAKQAAPREEVLILRKYVEMWDPLRYLTREEAERLLADNLKKLRT
jgi:hypothetical protein